MFKRSITGLGLIFIISIAVFASSYSFLLLLLLLANLGLIEYNRLFSLTENRPQKLTSHIIGSLVIVFAWMAVAQIGSCTHLPPLLPFLLLPLIIELFRNKATPFQNAMLTTGGVVWISLPFALFLAIAYLPFNQHHYHPALPMG